MAFKAMAWYLKLPKEHVQSVSGHSVRVEATQDLLALNWRPSCAEAARRRYGCRCATASI